MKFQGIAYAATEGAEGEVGKPGLKPNANTPTPKPTYGKIIINLGGKWNFLSKRGSDQYIILF